MYECRFPAVCSQCFSQRQEHYTLRLCPHCRARRFLVPVFNNIRYLLDGVWHPGWYDNHRPILTLIPHNILGIDIPWTDRYGWVIRIREHRVREHVSAYERFVNQVVRPNTQLIVCAGIVCLIIVGVSVHSSEQEFPVVEQNWLRYVDARHGICVQRNPLARPNCPVYPGQTPRDELGRQIEARDRRRIQAREAREEMAQRNRAPLPEMHDEAAGAFEDFLGRVPSTLVYAIHS